MATGDNIFEAVTADTIAHESARASKHSLPIGTPCPNCRTALAGPWCYTCGQRGEKYDRSIWRLAMEALEGITDFDGRLWKTLPRLVFRPGKLTREYLDGHRAGQVPPFRVFLIVLLIVFFAGGLSFSRSTNNFNLLNPNNVNVNINGMSPKDQADLKEAMSHIGEPGKDGKTGIQVGSSKSSAFWTGKVKRALANPQNFFQEVQEWGPKVAVLMLPIAALMLSFLFVFKKNTYVFDHLIFSMHSLSFQGLLLSAVFLAGLWLGQVEWALWLAPVHLFVHMRGTYRSSIFGTLLRMFLLFIGSSVAFGLLVAALFVIGLATVN
jgi:hypothetical protein